MNTSTLSGRRILFSFLFFFFIAFGHVNAQLTQELDDFQRNDNATVGTPVLGAPAWSEVESGTGTNSGCNIDDDNLRFSSTSTSTRDYVYRDCSSNYNTTYDGNTGTLLWEFSMKLNRDEPGGFANGVYGMAVILGSTTSSFHNSGDGYAVVWGSPSGGDPIKLVRFTGGFSTDANFTNMITYGDFDDQEDVLAIRVFYNPITHVWELWVDDDESDEDGDDAFDNTDYPNAVFRGSFVDNTYTNQNLRYLGAIYNHPSSTSNSARIDEILIPLIINPTYYYSKSTGNLNLTSTWGTNLDGSGANPPNFTTPAQFFNIRNNPSATIGAAWTVSGLTSNVILGDTVNPITFTVPAGFAFTGPIDIAPNGHLVLQHATVPTINQVGIPSIVDYASASTQAIRPIYYWDLICSSTGGRNWVSGTTGILDTFIVGLNAFTNGSGTVDFAGAQPQFIPPVRYENIINTGGGDRVLSPTGTIEIGGSSFTPTIGIYTVTGSTVDFSYTDNEYFPVLNVASGPNYNNLIFSGSGDHFQSGSMVVGGDMTIQAGDYFQNRGSTIYTTMVNGNLNLTGGDYYFSDDLGANVLTLKGNLNHSNASGRFRIDGTALGRITFAGTGIQTLTMTDSLKLESCIINIASGAHVKLQQHLCLHRNATIPMRGTLNVNSGGTLDCGNFRISSGIGTAGNAVFNLNNGGTLITANPNGVTGTVLAANMIATYNSGGSYEFNGGVAQTTRLVNTTVKNLTIDNTANVTLNANIFATGDINFLNGKFVTTPAFKITLDKLGTVTGAAQGKYVFGTFEKNIDLGTTSKSIEIGDATSYNPISLTFPAATNATGSLIGQVFTGDHPTMPGSGINPALTVNRHWTLTNNNVTGITPYDATFGFQNPADLDPGANSANFVVRNFSGSQWYATGPGTRTSTSTQGTSIPLFGEFMVGEPFPLATVTCPATVEVNASTTECSAVATFSVSTTGNPTPSLSYSQNPGTSFPVGTTPVTATVSNINGTTNCTFDVVIHDIYAPVISDCPADITDFASPGFCDQIAVWAPPTVTDNCSANMVNAYNPGDIFPVGTTTVSYVATDPTGNTSTCSFNVTIIDDQPPVLTDCPLDTTMETTGSCGRFLTWTEPTSSDNCSFNVGSNYASGAFFPVGVTTVTYTAIDGSGNLATCSFNVTVIDVEDPMITCPLDIAVNNDPGFCGAIVSFTPTASDNCTYGIVSTPASGSLFPVGMTTVNSVVTDASGRTASCSFNVTVTDNEDPQIFCLPDTSVNTDPLVYGRVVTFTVPATDNCGTTVVSDPPSGTFFLFGTTTVTSTVTDPYGHTATCSFNITVENTLEFDTNACDELTLPWGPTVTTSDDYFHTYIGGNGLDSVVTFHVTINYIDDNSVCTIDICNTSVGTVTHNIISIDDNNVCTTDFCDPIDSTSHTTLPIISDNNLCTQDGCHPITGEYHNVISPDDNNVCTIDDCDPLQGMSHILISIDDFDACTDDVCDPITGTTHDPTNRSDNNLCTLDGCDPGYGVFHVPYYTDDSNPCTDDICDPLTGSITHPLTNVDDNNVCTTDGCDTGTGVYHNQISVDDGTVCTIDICDLDFGVFHIPVSIDDNDVCTTDGCDAVTGPTHSPNPIEDDLNACTTDGCDPITGPTHTLDPIEDDSNVCTTDGCSTLTGPTHIPLPIVDDSNACTTDGCDSGTGPTHVTNPIEDDLNICTTDGCDSATGPTHVTNPIESDGNVCTTDGCDSVTGPTHVTNPIEDDSNVCTTDGCDSVTGPTHTANPIEDDGNACTADGCDSINGPTHTTNPIEDDGNVCTTDGCDTSTGPTHILLPVVDDGDACTTDGCDSVNGPIHPTSPIENDNNACTTDGCNTLTGPTHVLDPIEDDGNVCTEDGCSTLTGPTHILLPFVDDGNACTTDGCDSSTGETHVTDPIENDGNICTTDGCNTLTGPTHDLNPIEDDNNVCTADGCNSLTGPTHILLPIVDDGNACTIDGCDSVTGPTHVTAPIEDDGNVCTTDDCNTLTGPTHIPLPIEDDDDACTIDGCNSISGPTHVTAPIEDDGNVCTADGCNTLTGPTHIANPIEDDNNICTTDGCNSITGPTHIPLPIEDDGNACSTDGCDSVTGPTHVTNPIEDDNNICTTDGCDSNTGPTHTVNPIEDDNNICTTDGCDSVTGPTHVTNPIEDDNNICTTDGCDSVTGPTHVTNPIEDDNNICTTDGCNSITGPTHISLPIEDDGNTCTTDGCDSVTGPTHVTNPIEDDNNICTTDGCDSNTGPTHTVNPIEDDNNVCTTDGCNSITGPTHIPLPIEDDNNICTTDGCDSVTGPTHVTNPIEDDNNICTTDGCNSITGPTHIPLPIEDDNNACTTDGCDSVTGPTHVTNPIENDNNICTTDGCDSNTGPTHVVNPIEDDNDVCTTDGCNSITGPTHIPLPIEDDNNICTTDGCDSVTGPTHVTNPIEDDNNICTTDGCDSVTGPTHVTNPIEDDNNICTTDGCDSVTGPTHVTNPIENDNNACTTDGCNTLTGPTHVVNPIEDDNNACTTDGCSTLTGPTHVVNPIEDDNNACTTDGCSTLTGPTHVVNPIEDDNNACTTDGCSTLTGPTHVVNPIEDDNNACTTDGCSTLTGPTHVVNPIEDDNNACTTDGCSTLTGPTHVVNPIEDDNNACTTDGCSTLTGPTHVVNPIEDDNNACTTDGCSTLTGPTHVVNPIENDNNACTTDGCSTLTGPTHVTNPIVNDGNACTVDGCNTLSGETHTPVVTNDNNPCTTDGCDPVDGISHTPIPTTDNNACTVDACNTSNGQITHTPVPTNDGNACTTDACNSLTGVVSNTPVNTNDNSACTTDACNTVTGAITNTPVNINDNNVCTNDACDPATGNITHNPVNTNDNNACTNDGCTPPTAGIFHTPVNTNDNNPCTTDGCNPATGVTHVNNQPPAPGVNVVNSCASSQLTATGFTGSLLWSTNATTTSITVMSQGAYNVTQTVNGCTSPQGSGTATFGGVAPATPGAIAGPNSACRGQNGIVFSVTAVAGATSYLWVLPTGATGSSTTNSITVNFGVTFVTSNISVRAVNSCGQSNLSQKSITRLTIAPVAPGAIGFSTTTISGFPVLCPTTSTIFSVAAVANATNYAWATTGGLSVTSGQGTNKIVCSAPAGFIIGILSVNASNCIGTSTASSVTVKGLPSQPIWKTTPPAYACPGGSGYFFNIDNVQDASSYTYSAPAGCTITDVTNTVPSNPHVTPKSAFTVIFPAGFVSGNITMTPNNSCGTGQSLVYAIRSTPPQPGPITGSTPVCRSQTLPYSISPVAVATTYAWTVSGGATISTGQGTTNVTTRFVGSSGSPINLIVTASNSCGASPQRSLAITVNACKNAGEGSEEEAENVTDLTVYPNPISDRAMVTFNSLLNEEYVIRVFDVLGEAVVSEKVAAYVGYNEKEINLDRLSAGLYMISVQPKTGRVKTLRVIVE